MSNRFPKAEKLKSRKTIAALFEDGKSISKFPIKVFYLPAEENSFNRAAFAVPKRTFKFAVTRNRIKRQMREGYRLQKQLLEGNKTRKFSLLFLYLGKDEVSSQEIHHVTYILLKKLQDENN